MDEMIVVTQMGSFPGVLDNHVAADSGDEWNYSLLDHFLYILPADKSRQ